jgi:hypothetical protein
VNYLILQGNKGAIKRKVLSLGRERNIDEATLSQIKILIEKEEFKGRGWAYYIKAKGLKFGICGFEKDVLWGKRCSFLFTQQINYGARLR